MATGDLAVKFMRTYSHRHLGKGGYGWPFAQLDTALISSKRTQAYTIPCHSDSYPFIPIHSDSFSCILIHSDAF